MKATVETSLGPKEIDLSLPLDISIALKSGSDNVSAWNVGPVKIEPVVYGDFIGSVAAGASINFNNVLLNPHGNGTHTECVGHITEEVHSVNDCLKTFFFEALLITVDPELVVESTHEAESGDRVITQRMLEAKIGKQKPEAIIIRTLPNTDDKKTKTYSNTNPPYLLESAAKHINTLEIKHLLIDLPSVDRESDGGKLLAHKAFWGYPDSVRFDSTITELIHVKAEIPDDLYLLNIQITSLENDASPSKPTLFCLK